MDWSKALSASRRVEEYNALYSLSMDISSSRSTGGDVGTVTITLPRKYLPRLEAMIKEDMARLQKEVEDL